MDSVQLKVQQVQANVTRISVTSAKGIKVLIIRANLAQAIAMYVRHSVQQNATLVNVKLDIDEQHQIPAQVKRVFLSKTFTQQAANNCFTACSVSNCADCQADSTECTKCKPGFFKASDTSCTGLYSTQENFSY